MRFYGAGVECFDLMCLVWSWQGVNLVVVRLVNLFGFRINIIIQFLVWLWVGGGEGVFLESLNWRRKTTLNVGSTTLQSEVLGGVRRRRQMEVNIHFSVLLAMGKKWPSASSPTTMLFLPWKLWAKFDLSFLKLPGQWFCHSSKMINKLGPLILLM